MVIYSSALPHVVEKNLCHRPASERRAATAAAALGLEGAPRQRLTQFTLLAGYCSLVALACVLPITFGIVTFAWPLDTTIVTTEP